MRATHTRTDTSVSLNLLRTVTIALTCLTGSLLSLSGDDGRSLFSGPKLGSTTTMMTGRASTALRRPRHVILFDAPYIATPPPWRVPNNKLRERRKWPRGIRVVKNVCIEASPARQVNFPVTFTVTRRLVAYDGRAGEDRIIENSVTGDTPRGRWRIVHKPGALPTSHRFVPQNAVFATASCIGHLGHFMQDTLRSLYYVLDAVGQLEFGPTDIHEREKLARLFNVTKSGPATAYYSLPPIYAHLHVMYDAPYNLPSFPVRYCTNMTRWAHLLRGFGAAPDGVRYFGDYPVNTCYRNAVFADGVSKFGHVMPLIHLQLHRSVPLALTPNVVPFTKDASVKFIRTNYTRADYARLRERVGRNLCADSVKGSTLVLAERSDYRMILNMKDLLAQAQRLGVKRVGVWNFAALTRDEQYDVVHCSDLYVGVQGAANAWTATMHAGAEFVEFGWPGWPTYRDALSEDAKIHFYGVTLPPSAVRANWTSFVRNMHRDGHRGNKDAILKSLSERDRIHMVAKNADVVVPLEAFTRVLCQTRYLKFNRTRCKTELERLPQSNATIKYRNAFPPGVRDTTPQWKLNVLERTRLEKVRQNSTN